MKKTIKLPIRKPETPANLQATPVLPTRNKPQTCNNPTRAKIRRKIDGSVIAQMAQAVATMLTETEAARLCGIEPRHWFEWKSRAGRDGKFSALLEEFRANKIAGLLERVQKSADGVDVKFPEFRAALALLKFQDQKRFGDSPAVAINPCPAVTINLIHDQLKRVIGFASDADVKALPSSAPAGEPLPAPKQIPPERKN